MTQIIVEAFEKTGQRGIINKGWGGLGECKFPALLSDPRAFFSFSFLSDKGSGVGHGVIECQEKVN